MEEPDFKRISKDVERLEYTLKSFAKATIYAVEAISELSKYFEEVEQHRIWRRNLKRKIFWIRFFNIFKRLKNRIFNLWHKL